MDDVRVIRKLEVIKRGKRLVDMSKAMGYGYNRFSKILNQFENEPPDFDRKFREVLELWDNGEATKVSA